jgi:hypothetical protein
VPCVGPGSAIAAAPVARVTCGASSSCSHVTLNGRRPYANPTCAAARQQSESGIRLQVLQSHIKAANGSESRCPARIASRRPAIRVTADVKLSSVQYVCHGESYAAQHSRHATGGGCAGTDAQRFGDKRTQTVGKCAGREFFRLGYEQGPAIDQGQQMTLECALTAC